MTRVSELARAVVQGQKAKVATMQERQRVAQARAREVDIRCDDRHMEQSVTKVGIELWRRDDVVLFDWLMSVDLNTIPIMGVDVKGRVHA